MFPISMINSFSYSRNPRGVKINFGLATVLIPHYCQPKI